MSHHHARIHKTTRQRFVDDCSHVTFHASRAIEINFFYNPRIKLRSELLCYRLIDVLSIYEVRIISHSLVTKTVVLVEQHPVSFCRATISDEHHGSVLFQAVSERGFDSDSGDLPIPDGVLTGALFTLGFTFFISSFTRHSSSLNSFM